MAGQFTAWNGDHRSEIARDSGHGLIGPVDRRDKSRDERHNEELKVQLRKSIHVVEDHVENQLPLALRQATWLISQPNVRRRNVKKLDHDTKRLLRHCIENVLEKIERQPQLARDSQEDIKHLERCLRKIRV